MYYQASRLTFCYNHVSSGCCGRSSRGVLDSFTLKLGLFHTLFKIGASLLHHALKTLSPASQKRVSQSYIAMPGLSFNHNAVNFHETCQYQIDHYLFNRNVIGIWHDAVSNSISHNHANNFNVLIPNQLEKCLLNYKHIIHEIVYCKRVGRKDFYSKLKKSGILVINIVTELIFS